MTGEDDERRATPSRWQRLALPAALAVVAGAVGYGVGFARGTTDVGGPSPTTSIVSVPPGSEGADPGPPTVDPDLVPEAAETVSFDAGIPADAGGATVAASGAWVTVEGQAQPAEPTTWPADSEEPPTPDEAPALTVADEEPLGVVSVRLVAPTPGSGLVLAADAATGWQVAIGPELDELVLYQLVEGRLEARGSASAAVTDGTTLALFQRNGRFGVAVDGEEQEIDGFFGRERDLDGGGVVPTSAVVVAGSGQPRFDELAFG